MRKLLSTLALGLLALPAFGAPFNEDKFDVEYSRPNGKPLLLDIHVPEGKGPFPGVIVVHGGGFDQGTKKSYVGPVLEVLTTANYAWFSIDYRLAPDFRFPQPVEDVNAAIRWVKANAKTYHVDPSKLVLLGESAGAYLTSYAATHETAETRLAANVEFYAPSDYTRLALLRRDHPERFELTSANRHLANGGGIHFFSVDALDAPGLAKLKEVSPVNAVHKGMAPFLLIHGTADDQVAYELSPDFCAAIRKTGTRCELITVEGGKHGMSSWAKAPDMQHWKPELVAWLNKTLGN
jgi:acetyl esterase